MSKFYSFQRTVFTVFLMQVSTSFSSLQDTCELEPPFGEDAWYGIGFTHTSYEEAPYVYAASSMQSTIASSSPSSPPHWVSCEAASSLHTYDQNMTSASPMTSARKKATVPILPNPWGQIRSVPLQPENSLPEQARKKISTYFKPIQRKEASAAYVTATHLLEQGSPEDLKDCLPLFLTCYRSNTAYRWEGCLGVACTYLKQGNASNALLYIKRILKTQRSSKKVTAEAQKLLDFYYPQLTTSRP